MNRKMLTRFLLASSFALSTFSVFANDTESSPQTKISKIEDEQKTDGDVNTLNQFSVICLTNRASEDMNFRWTDNSAHDAFLPKTYQQAFYWSDTNTHSITVQYDSDMTAGVAWKTYRLDSSPAPFPDCKFGRQYQFSNADARWVDIYTAIAP